MDGDYEGVDRRAQGVQRVIAIDGNGGKDDSIRVNVQTAKVWINLLKALAALLVIVGGAVWGGVRYGISSEVHGEVEGQIKHECQEGGKIDVHVRQISEEFMEEVQGVLQDDLDDLDVRQRATEETVAGMKGSVDTLISDNARNVEEIKMLIQRAIDEGGGG
jgi:hypothetical protein